MFARKAETKAAASHRGSAEHLDEDLAFAIEVLNRVCMIAVDLGARRKLGDAGCLAAQLFITKLALEEADERQLAKLQKRLVRLMDDLGKVCMWPELSSDEERWTLLQELRRPKTHQSGKAAEKTASRGILNFLKAPLTKDQYMRKLDRFCQVVPSVAKLAGGRSTQNQARAGEDWGLREAVSSKRTMEGVTSADDYPLHVNDKLYQVLRSHLLSCSCTTQTEAGINHHARLRLQNEISLRNECILFDMLLSASPASWIDWQDVQVRVPTRKRRTGRSVAYVGEEPLETRVEQEPFKVIQPGTLCSLIQTKPGARICCRIQDTELHQLYDGLPILQDVDPGPSVPLCSILGTRRLSSRMKLVLAYIVARSFWQYYDSPWMSKSWTSESIHFLPEGRPKEGLPHGALFASSPYFAVDFGGEMEPTVEYCRSYSMIFRYPRLLALCVILLEIGRGQVLRIDRQDSEEAKLNIFWSTIKSLVSADNGWGDFDYSDYRNMIANCLNFKSSNQSSDPSTAASDIFERKAAVLKLVVQPLEVLLKKLEYWDDFKMLGPIDTKTPHVLDKPPPVQPGTLPFQQTESRRSCEWMQRVNAINGCLFQRFRAGYISQSAKRVKIAVLDTGFDPESVFFYLEERRARYKGYKDFTQNASYPEDANGHGTHTFSVVMKVAPMADVYMGRIAKEKGSLKGSAHAIAQAIDWAANEVEADIISMSFGFQDEIPLISNAIQKALITRNNKIIFFAAASNFGGNRKEMFPANHDSVVSIRETNSHGSFSDTNPPVDPAGPAVFGTVGKEVPAAWLSTVEGEIAKSGSSVATAVAAGLAGIILGLLAAAPEMNLPPEVENAWTKRGMEAIFRRLSNDMGNRTRFVTPIPSFTGKDPAATLLTAISDACMSA